MRYAPSAPRGAAALVTVLLAINASAVAAMAYFEVTRGQQLADELTLLAGGVEPPKAVVGAVTVFSLLVLLMVLSLLATVMAYLRWLLQASRRAADDVRPAMVITVWFVPVINLVAPPFLVDRVWRASRSGESDGHSGRAGWMALLTAWWLASLTAVVLAVLRPCGLLRGAGVPPEPGVSGVCPASVAAVGVAAALCAVTVWAITVRQARSAGVWVTPAKSSISSTAALRS